MNDLVHMILLAGLSAEIYLLQRRYEPDNWIERKVNAGFVYFFGACGLFYLYQLIFLTDLF